MENTIRRHLNNRVLLALLTVMLVVGIPTTAFAAKRVYNSAKTSITVKNAYDVHKLRICGGINNQMKCTPWRYNNQSSYQKTWNISWWFSVKNPRYVQIQRTDGYTIPWLKFNAATRDVCSPWVDIHITMNADSPYIEYDYCY